MKRISRIFILIAIVNVHFVDAQTIRKTEYKEKIRGFWLGSCIANWTGLKTEAARNEKPYFTDEDWNTNQGNEWHGAYIDFVLDKEIWGADDDTDQRRYERPQKYFWTEHAERNAIYKAARLGISLRNNKMYFTSFPCADCLRAIIQAGIKKLFTEKPDFNHERWGESWVEALIMLKECGVEVVWSNDITNWSVEYMSSIKEWSLTANCENGPIWEKYFNSVSTLKIWADANDIKFDLDEEEK